MRRHGLATLGLVAVVTQCFVAPPLRPTRRGRGGAARDAWAAARRSRLVAASNRVTW
jgi:hypothetical protein